MREHTIQRSDRPKERDPLTRAQRRDLAATLERDYARELRREIRAAMLDRFWDRRYA